MSPAMWTELFHRASREPIGIAIRVNNPPASVARLHKHRPTDPTYRDYTVARTPIPDLIFIVKPGVTLDDPAISSEILSGGPAHAQ